MTMADDMDVLAQRDFATVDAIPLRSDDTSFGAQQPLLSSTIFGPTCDGENMKLLREASHVT